MPYESKASYATVEVGCICTNAGELYSLCANEKGHICTSVWLSIIFFSTVQIFVHVFFLSFFHLFKGVDQRDSLFLYVTISLKNSKFHLFLYTYVVILQCYIFLAFVIFRKNLLLLPRNFCKCKTGKNKKVTKNCDYKNIIKN